MTTLLQKLLLETLPPDVDPILKQFIDTVLPAMEQHFGHMSALGGSQAVHQYRLEKLNDAYASEKSGRWASSPDQSLLVHVTNALLIAWSLISLLPQPLKDEEKRLICLGLTLHDYNKYCQGEEEDAPKAHQVEEILSLCQEMGELLNFSEFWADWQQYLSDIGFLAQNTQFKVGTNSFGTNWPSFQLRKRRLENPLRSLLRFGDIAVHIANPAEVLMPAAGKSKPRGEVLRECLETLGIDRALTYHRLRQPTGILSNQVHNAVLHFTEKLDWQPLLYFAQGVIYLAPPQPSVPEREVLKEALWQAMNQMLASYMLTGEIGFKRDGKGVKVAPQTLELFEPIQIIRGLPKVIEARVQNAKVPATPKRLAAIELSEEERSMLSSVADLRSDRMAEAIFLLQKEFFGNRLEFVQWVLDWLDISNKVTPEQTQEQKGGVNYGWYRAAAHYINQHRTFDEEQTIDSLVQFTKDIATWATKNQLLTDTDNPTRAAFFSYLDSGLEISGWQPLTPPFDRELERYVIAKTKSAKQPICSLSSGEFVSEDQMDSVVLFKPQQYSNKNTLGGNQIKRGISKVWSLEMLLRQALWAVPSGKLEDQQPIFLYLFPAYVYSPQMARAVRLLTNDLKRVKFREILRFWIRHDCDIRALQQYPWLTDPEPTSGDLFESDYGKGRARDIPFMGISYTKTQGKTLTDAWVEPAFLSLAIAMLLGIKVVATPSQVPLYNSDSDFFESVKLDGPANFWTVLGLPESLHLEEWHRGQVWGLGKMLERLLIAYSVHLDSKASPKDNRWRSLPATVRDLASHSLNLFALAEAGLRQRKQAISPDLARRYWHFATVWSKGDTRMTKTLNMTKRLVEEYRQFYRVRSSDSNHAILLPLSKALEIMLSVPHDLSDEDLILQGAGQLKAAIERQKPYTRPIWMNKQLTVPERIAQEVQAIETFMTTCVEDLFRQQYSGDRALLQENRNRIKSGAAFAYQLLAIDEDATKE